MSKLVNIFKTTAPDGSYDDAARREAYAQALRERAMRQRGPAPGGPVQAQYGIGEGLTQLAEALLARRAGKSAIDAKKMADTQQTQQNDATIGEMLPATQMQARRADPETGQLGQSVGRVENMQSDALSMALRGQDPQAIGKFLAERKLASLMPEPQDPISLSYGAKLVTPQGEELASNDRLPGQNGGGSSSEMQYINRYLTENPGASFDQASEAYRGFKETYTNAERAGVGGVVGNRSGAFIPQTNIDTVADNASTVEAAKEGGKIEGTTETQRFYDAPLAKVAVDSGIAQVDAFISKVGNLANDPNLDRATGLWNYVPSIYGGGAADADAAIESLLADVGFQNLQNMRDNSKTGGALGNVTVRELEMLQNQIASLKQSQSKEAYVNNLKTLVKMANGRKERLRKAYDAEFGSAAATNPRGRARPTQPAPVNEIEVDW